MKNNPACSPAFLACRVMACLVLLTVLAVAFGALAAPSPAFAQADTATPTPEPSITPTRTPIPAAYLQTDFQTSGLVIGASVLVIVIVGGTLFAIRRSDQTK